MKIRQKLSPTHTHTNKHTNGRSRRHFPADTKIHQHCNMFAFDYVYTPRLLHIIYESSAHSSESRSVSYSLAMGLGYLLFVTLPNNNNHTIYNKYAQQTVHAAPTQHNKTLHRESTFNVQTNIQRNNI